MAAVNIEKATVENRNYRKVIATTKQQQLVLMFLNPGEEIGSEIHDDTTQFFKVEGGSGFAAVGDECFKLDAGDSIMVPAGVRHNVWTVETPLALYTIYSPPHHPENTLQKCKPTAQ